ncbi:MAG: pyridoxamine 5'-phosphate oxidase family protein [Myxococcales bacterium]|nr:pyridoxamine 5'-phosphate oxidase family protein [Myxococcales bacterium]MDD9969389.1 pyridoxamine 5'-phosphate oxidase family protein [Myxococcales bacterium]
MEDGGYQEVVDAHSLREVLGKISPRTKDKERAALHPLQKRWIEASPFCLVATAAANGRCDVSPKGDAPGFTLVLDDTTLAIPERPGNRRADGFHNILENPHVGLIYLLPGRTDTLRVNGRARILREAPFFDRMIANGHRPKLALLIDIEEIFFHCSKAFLRSELWKPQTWQPEQLPPHAEISYALNPKDTSIEKLREYYGETYTLGLYQEKSPD